MINFLEALSTLPANIDAHREEAYKANFFMSKSNRCDYEAKDAPLWPTSFEEQNLFLEPYEHGFELTHDIYSIIYKPLVLTLVAGQSLLLSGVLATQALSGGLAFLSKFIPSPVELDGQELMELDTHDSLDKAKQSAIQLLASIYLLVVCLPIDTISSVLSAVCRSLTTVCSGVSALFSDDKSSAGYFINSTF